MATQGEIRARAKSAVRRARAVYRTADSQGEKVERELDRLIKRKSLITVSSLRTLNNLIANYVRSADNMSQAATDLYSVVQNTMQL